MHNTNLNSQQIVNKRLNEAKVAYAAHPVYLDAVKTLLADKVRPNVGDLVLARVQKIGQHKKIELTNGRRARMFVGDEIVVVYGNRYAPDQFEAVIPDTLAICHLVAAGGIASKLLCKHDSMQDPTVIAPIGLLGDDQARPINLSNFALKRINCISARPLTIVVAGTSMNAGKTTTVASLIKGLTASGMKTGAAKISGTGAGGDIWFMKDSGAKVVLDFVDAGFPSTYRLSFNHLEKIAGILTSQLHSAGVDLIVLEVADGLYQKETAKLLTSKNFRKGMDGMIFAAREAMGGKAGVEWLRKHDIPVLALSGSLTASPLAIREAMEVVDMPVVTSETLSRPTVAEQLNCWLSNQKTVQSARA
ncbi:MAG: hypothetical protein KAJ90_02525 [Desulfobacterales bacterium]|nr:hypothetical protein [Desulfobacterales bacterium]